MGEFRVSPNCYISYSFTDGFGDLIPNTIFINKFICIGENIQKGTGMQLLLAFLLELKRNRSDIKYVKLLSDFREGEFLVPNTGLTEEQKQTKLNEHYVKLGFRPDPDAMFDNEFVGIVDDMIINLSRKGGTKNYRKSKTRKRKTKRRTYRKK